LEEKVIGELTRVNGQARELTGYFNKCKFLCILLIIQISMLVAPSGVNSRILPEGSNPFSGGFELGPNILNFDSIADSLLPAGRNDGTGSLLSFWFRFGVRIKKVDLLARFGLTGGYKKNSEYADTVNSGTIGLLSIITSADIFRYKRFQFGGAAGYQYTRFDAYTSENPDLKYKIDSHGPIIAAYPSFILKESAFENAADEDIKIGDNIALDLGFEHTFGKHPLNRLEITLKTYRRMDSNFIRFRIINYKNVCQDYVLTIGAFAYFGF